MDQLHCGGIEKSIVTFLSELPLSDYSVTLMLQRRGGVFEKYLPGGVEVVSVPLTDFGRSMFEDGRKAMAIRFLKEGSLLKLMRIVGVSLWGQFFVKPSHRSLYYFRKSIEKKSFEEVTYDVAIAYHNIEQALFVADYINARKKLTWFHTELSKLPIPPTTYDTVYRKFDYYVSSSKAVGEELREFFPEMVHKLKLIPYSISIELCQKLASEYVPFEQAFNGLRLLSVGRLSKQKGFDLAVEIFDRLQRKGYEIEWTIIGEGTERAALEQMIAERKLEGFHLIGLKENPYPYFAECDIYVQPSRYEGYCITLGEARMFAKPSVVTDFAGAREQLKPGETGLIVECQVPEIEQAVQSLIEDAGIRQKFADNLHAENESRSNNDCAFGQFLKEQA